MRNLFVCLVLVAFGSAACSTSTTVLANGAETDALAEAITTDSDAPNEEAVPETSETTLAIEDAEMSMTSSTAIPSGSDRPSLSDLVMEAAEESAVDSFRFEGATRIRGHDDSAGPIDAVSKIKGERAILGGDMEMWVDSSDLYLALDAEYWESAKADIPAEGSFIKTSQRKIVGDRAFETGIGAVFAPPGSDTPVSHWFETTKEESEPSFGAPSMVISILGNVHPGTKTVGSSMIRGVEATHYAIEVNPGEVVSMLPEDQKKAYREMFGAERRLSMNVWIDDDGLLGRVEFETPASAFEDEQLRGMSYWVEFYDYSADIVINLPPAEHVLG